MAVFRINVPAGCSFLDAHKDLIQSKYRRAVASIISRVIDNAVIETVMSMTSMPRQPLDSFHFALGLRGPKALIENAFYDNAFMRALLASTIVVSHKITQPDSLVLSTIAEEIAFSRFVCKGFVEYELAHDDEGLSEEDCEAFDSLVDRFVSDGRVQELYMAGRAGHNSDERMLHNLWTNRESWFTKRARRGRGFPYHPSLLSGNKRPSLRSV